MAITPASAPDSRTAWASTGVGSGPGRTRLPTPRAASTRAVSVAKSSLWWRASKPTTTSGGSDLAVANNTSATAAATERTSTRFIRIGPAPRRPRIPAVPNARRPPKRSSSSSPPAASSRSVSARVSGSGSTSSHRRAVSSARLMVGAALTVVPGPQLVGRASVVRRRPRPPGRPGGQPQHRRGRPPDW